MRAIRLIWRTLGGLWSVLMILLMAGSLALNIAMAVVPAVALAVGSAVEAVTGVRSVASRNAARTASLEGRAVKAEARAAAEAAEARAARQVTYRGARRTAAEAVADTSDRLARRAARGAGRSLASTAGEAIPVVGIGVIAAATAWELHDSCEMMKEVRALDVALNPDRAIPPEATEVCGMKAPTRAEIWSAVAASPGAAWDEARSLYGDLPSLDLGGAWGASLGMFRAIYDWAFGAEAGPTAPDGIAPAASATDWNPLNWWGAQ